MIMPICPYPDRVPLVNAPVVVPFSAPARAPRTDVIVVARAMASPSLWVKVAGRRMRTFPGKDDCVVLDHGSNTDRLGPINAVKPVVFGKRKVLRRA